MELPPMKSTKRFPQATTKPHKIYNGLVAFADGGEFCSPNYKQYIAYIILNIFGIDIHR